MTDPITRALLIDLRSLLLKAVDLIERHLVIGKYKTNMIDLAERDNRYTEPTTTIVIDP
jgi:hypothetical protein